MNKDYFDKIEEFDEADLPNVEMNVEEVKRVKESVIKIVKSLKDRNKNLDFNITLEGALKLKNELGNNADKAIYGTKCALLMRSIMLKTIEEEEGLKKEDIVDELFRNVHAPTWWWGAAVCYKLFLTKEKLIIYSFDSHYKVFSNYKVSIGEVIEAGRAGKEKCIMDEDEQIIVLKDTKIVLSPDYGGSKDDLLRFMESLRNMGVNDVDRSGFPWQDFLMKFLWILVVIVILYIIMTLVKF
ncbi:MAG: hypothetical protein ACRCVJ_05165 [Clostridium sp.]|uniref:hypothetical protein n=1 Tax=Clostridium sp. TaxID=1506 RepID=UPI003F3908A8